MYRTQNEDDPAHVSHGDYLISTNGFRAESIEYPCDALPQSTIEKLLSELDGHHMERCGFITNNFEIVRVQNVHTDPHNNFYMDEEDANECFQYIYEELKDHIIGIYHTHPNGYPWPSPRDIVGWPNLALNWRYFLVSRGNVTEWRLVRDGT